MDLSPFAEAALEELTHDKENQRIKEGRMKFNTVDLTIELPCTECGEPTTILTISDHMRLAHPQPILYHIDENTTVHRDTFAVTKNGTHIGYVVPKSYKHYTGKPSPSFDDEFSADIVYATSPLDNYQGFLQEFYCASPLVYFANIYNVTATYERYDFWMNGKTQVCYDKLFKLTYVFYNGKFTQVANGKYPPFTKAATSLKVLYNGYTIIHNTSTGIYMAKRFPEEPTSFKWDGFHWKNDAEYLNDLPPPTDFDTPMTIKVTKEFTQSGYKVMWRSNGVHWARQMTIGMTYVYNLITKKFENVGSFGQKTIMYAQLDLPADTDSNVLMDTTSFIKIKYGKFVVTIFKSKTYAINANALNTDTHEFYICENDKWEGGVLPPLNELIALAKISHYFD